MTQTSLPEIDPLRSLPLFKTLNEAALKEVARMTRSRRIEADDFLFQQGDPAESLYMVQEGRVKLGQVTPEGQQVILRIATPGEAIAVVAVLADMVYPVSAQAVEDSRLLYWDKASMRWIMERFPAVALNAIQVLSLRVREFQDRVRELATEKVERRIARALLRLARQTGRKVSEGVLIDLTLSRQDLAQMTGTTLYTVSRTLSQWENMGLIKSGREQIIIRFPHGLVTIAEDLPMRPEPEEEDPFKY